MANTTRCASKNLHGLSFEALISRLDTYLELDEAGLAG